MVAAMKALPLKVFLTAAALAAAFAQHAAAAVGAWGEGSRAEVRLVASGVGDDGMLSGGIEIALPPGWKTYWRYPGDAGVAPLFDFGGSRNLATTPAIAFPVPTREDDGFAVTNVYLDHVLLPFTAKVTDPAQPVEIALRARIGACEEICIPEDISIALTVPPGAADPDVGDQLAAAMKTVPGAAAPGAFAFSAVARAGGTDRRPIFRFTGVVPDAKDATLFVEGPGDWAPYTPERVADGGGEAAWTVKFSRLGAETPIAGASFRLTAVSGDKAIEQTVTLP